MAENARIRCVGVATMVVCMSWNVVAKSSRVSVRFVPTVILATLNVGFVDEKSVSRISEWERIRNLSPEVVG